MRKQASTPTTHPPTHHPWAMWVVAGSPAAVRAPGADWAVACAAPCRWSAGRRQDTARVRGSLARGGGGMGTGAWVNTAVQFWVLAAAPCPAPCGVRPGSLLRLHGCGAAGSSLMHVPARSMHWHAQIGSRLQARAARSIYGTPHVVDPSQLRLPAGFNWRSMCRYPQCLAAYKGRPCT